MSRRALAIPGGCSLAVLVMAVAIGGFQPTLQAQPDGLDDLSDQIERDLDFDWLEEIEQQLEEDIEEALSSDRLEDEMPSIDELRPVNDTEAEELEGERVAVREWLYVAVSRANHRFYAVGVHLEQHPPCRRFDYDPEGPIAGLWNEDYRTELEAAKIAILEADSSTVEGHLDAMAEIVDRVRDKIEERCRPGLDDVDSYRSDVYGRTGDLGNLFDFADNLVFSDRRSLEATLDRERLRKIAACVNPPQERFAAYSIGVIDAGELGMFSDRQMMVGMDIRPLERLSIPYPDDFRLDKQRFRRGLDVDRLYDRVDLPPELVSSLSPPDGYRIPQQFRTDLYDDPRELTEGLVESGVTAPDYAEKPQMRIAFDLATGHWSWAPGKHWGDDRFIDNYRQLQQKLAAPSVLRQTVVDDVCELVEAVESSIPAQRRTEILLREDLDRLERLFEVVGVVFARLAPHWFDDSDQPRREEFGPPGEDFDEAIERMRRAVENGDLDTAVTALVRAADTYAEVVRTMEVFVESEETAVELRDRLDELEDDLVFRSNLMMPRRIEAWDVFERAETSVENLEKTLEDRSSVRELREATRNTREAIEDFEQLFEDATETHNVNLVVLSLGALGVVVVLIAGGVHLTGRRRRRSFDTAAEIHTTVVEWENRHDRLQRRFADLRTEIDDQREQLEATLTDEQRETIDVLIALSVRLEAHGDMFRDMLDRADSPEGKRMAIDEMLRSGAIEIGPEEGADGTYTFDRDGILEAFEEMIEEAEGMVG